MSREALHVLLTAVGFLCEGVGLTWVVADASRARWREYREPSVLRRIGNWFNYWLFEEPPPMTRPELAGTVTGSGGSSDVPSIGGVANETPMQRLQREVTGLRQRFDEQERTVASRLSNLERRPNAAIRGWPSRSTRLTPERSRFAWPLYAARCEARSLFFLGAFLSALANLI
jgi:hypothetical protein